MKKLSAPESTIKNILNLFFVILTVCFSLFFWNIAGLNLNGDPYSLGFLHIRMETVFPFIAFLLWGIFFVEYILFNFNKREPIRRFYWTLLLALLSANILTSMHPENSISWLSLWITMLLMTFISGISIKTKLVWQSFGVGIGLGFFWHYGLDPLVSLPLLGGASLIFLWAGLHFIKNFHQFIYLCLFVSLGIILSQNLLIFLIFFPLVIMSFLFFNKKIKRINHQDIIGFMAFILCLFFWFFLFYSNLSYSEFPSIFFPPHIWHGIGLGEFLQAQQDFSLDILTQDKLIFPPFGISLLWYEQGFLGILFFLILTLLTLNFKPRDWKIKIFIFLCLTLLIPEFLFTENGLLLTGFIFLPKEEIINH